MAFLNMKKWLPLVTFLLLVCISVKLWKDENAHTNQLTFHHTQTTADQIKIRIEGLMKARIASLQVLADRWVERTPPDFSQTRFFQFAEDIYIHYPGFAAINWIDPEGKIRWVYPEEKNSQARGKTPLSHHDLRYREAFEKAKTSLREEITPSVELLVGGLGFETFWPLISDGTLQGYLNGVFRISQIMDVCLTKEILNDFWLKIYEGDKLVYVNKAQDEADRIGNARRVVCDVIFPGKTWGLELEPKTTEYYATKIQNFPILIFGLAISVILFLLLNYLFKRMELYREARNQALQQIEERKKAEETLQENKRRLESLLSELAAKNEELETFVYSVSHDLKTPIITIDGFVGALREDFGDLLPEDGERYLNYMNDATRKMGLLIGDLLELSRIGRLTEDKAELSFGSLVEEVLGALQPMIQERDIEVVIQQNLPLIYGERKRLLQVLENLLSNAVKYIGKENPFPRIEVGGQAQDGQMVYFVHDNGIGIEERYFDKIFQVFQRLSPAKMIAEGTGMGLTIVKRIIEHHGGRIWLESEPGKGTTFFFTLKEKEP